MPWIKSKYRRFYFALGTSALRIFGSILLVFAALLIWKTMLLAGISIAILQLVGMVFLPVLRVEYALMSLLSYPVGKLVGVLAMGIIYFGVITPIGIFRKRTFQDGWVESVKDVNPGKMHE